MEFTKENWENAPEGAVVERDCVNGWEPVSLIGFASGGRPVIESRSGCAAIEKTTFLRIILPKRRVTVQLWRMSNGYFTTSYVDETRWVPSKDWTLLAEHTFEIEGELWNTQIAGRGKPRSKCSQHLSIPSSFGAMIDLTTRKDLRVK